jgi:hypothetical protein
MIESEYRAPSEREMALLHRLLGVPFLGRDELVQQLSDLRVRRIDEDGSFALLVTKGVRAPVRERIPVEARYKDVDVEPENGPYVYALLHVVDGRMTELEIFKEDGSPIIEQPNPETLEVIASPKGSVPE